MKTLQFTKEWFRNFSSNVTGVIIGIALTFGITFLVQHRQERKQADHLLSMVRAELELNIRYLELQKEYLVNEFAGARALRPYVYDPQSVPADTLQKYGEAMSRIMTFDPATSSLDVMKNSPQVQAIADKGLLARIFNIYDAIGSYPRNVYSSFTESKNKGITDYYNHMDGAVAEEAYRDGGDAMLIFADMMRRSDVLRNYIVSTAGGNCETFIPQADEMIGWVEELIAQIDNEIN